MKRKCIDGSHWVWLEEAHSAIRPVSGSLPGWTSLIDIQKVRRRIMVPYEDGEVCIIDDGYRWLVFLPEGRNWCMTALYDRQHEIIEWYFDIIAGQGMDESGKPWYDDLYLDIVLRPDGKIIILDEDELAQARGDGLVTAEQFEMAHRACRELIDSGMISLGFMVPFCKNLLSLFACS